MKKIIKDTCLHIIDKVSGLVYSDEVCYKKALDVINKAYALKNKIEDKNDLMVSYQITKSDIQALRRFCDEQEQLSKKK